jgi:hypothetical protein
MKSGNRTAERAWERKHKRTWLKRTNDRPSQANYERHFFRNASFCHQTANWRGIAASVQCSPVLVCNVKPVRTGRAGITPERLPLRQRGVARVRHDAATTRQDVTETVISEATTGNAPPARRRLSHRGAYIETLAFPRRRTPLAKSSPKLTWRRLPLARQGRFSV